MTITEPTVFFSATNLSNLAGQLPPLFLAALGQTFVLLGAGFDLSVGAVISMTSAILTLDSPPLINISLAIMAAAFVGLVNGVGIVRFSIHPIIMTLATMSIVQGLTLMLLPVPGGVAPELLIKAASGTLFGIPAGGYWIIAGIAISVGLIHFSRFGVWLFASGENPDIARMSGVPSSQIRILTYIICSLMAALAGAYLTGRLASGDPLVGRALGLDSVLGAAVGGTLLSGGIGGPVGTVSGVLIIGIMNNGLNLMQVSPFYQFVVKGCLLIAAVGLFRRDEAGL